MTSSTAQLFWFKIVAQIYGRTLRLQHDVRVTKAQLPETILTPAIYSLALVKGARVIFSSDHIEGSIGGSP
jgi:hypothetical protein